MLDVRRGVTIVQELDLQVTVKIKCVLTVAPKLAMNSHRHWLNILQGERLHRHPDNELVGAESSLCQLHGLRFRLEADKLV